MKKKAKFLFGMVLCIVLCCALFTACSKKQEDNKTDDTPEKVEVVSTAKELYDKLYEAAENNYSQKYTIKLGNDIDLSELDNWKPIGRTLSKAFSATLDGDNNKITGLKITGWDENGTPKYIAKEIIGWLDSGEAVYKSDEIVELDRGAENSDGVYPINGIVREGDDADSRYQALQDGKGVFEQRAAFGSVGLFGYTDGAIIQNITIENADISFYATGEYAYAGVVSGYDVASQFKNVVVNNSKIEISTIYEREYGYTVKYGTPDNVVEDVNNNKQFVGGVVGYAKGSTVFKDGKGVNNSTTFQGVESNGFTFGNVNYSAYFNAEIVVKGKDDSAYLATNLKDGNGQYSAFQSVSRRSKPVNSYFPEQLMVGGIAGYVSGADMNDVKVDSFNRGTIQNEAQPNKITEQKYILAKSLYFGGIAAGAYNSTVCDISVKNTFASGVYWTNWNNSGTNRGYSLVYDKATVGGAFADIGRTVIKASAGNNNVAEGVYFEIGETNNLENICLGGFVGYADDQSVISSVKVDGAYMYSADIGEGASEKSELGSVLAGVVGVLRNSTLTASEAEGVKFEIGSTRPGAYKFAKGIVSQIMGNSTLSDSSAKDVYKWTQAGYDATKDYESDEERITPVSFNNNYVNEDGYKSMRLYYQVKDANDNYIYDKVYVTAFAEIIPADAEHNALYEEKVLKTVDLSGLYQEGQAIDTTKNYYRYDSNSGNYIDITQEGVKSLGFDKYTANGKYAQMIDAYRVEFVDKNKDLENSTVRYYEYTASKAEFVLTGDKKAVEGKTYYALKEDVAIDCYYLMLTVYSESGKVIVVDEKDSDDEDDDVLAKARYILTKETVETTAIEYSVAETYFNTFFEVGKGFKKDVNDFVIAYYDSGVKNRNFTQYVQKTGRPVVDAATIEYK